MALPWHYVLLFCDNLNSCLPAEFHYKEIKVSESGRARERQMNGLLYYYITLFQILHNLSLSS